MNHEDFKELERQINIASTVELVVYMLGLGVLVLLSYCISTFGTAVPS